MAINSLEDESLQPVAQSIDPSKSLRCYPRRPEDGKIKWHQSTRDVHALIRASSHPFSGAFSFLETGEKIKIWRVDIIQDFAPFCAIPGQILYREDECAVIACADGALKILEASLDTKTDDKLAMKMLLKSVRARLG